MAIYFAAKIIDVTDTPVKGARTFLIVGGTSTPMKETATRGVYELEVPAGAAQVEFSGARTGLFGVNQRVDIDASTTPPTAKLAGDQHLNVRGVAVYTRGSDYNVELDVVMGQLRDATKVVQDLAAAEGIDLGIAPKSIHTFATPILRSPGGGNAPETLMNITDKTVDPKGPLLFAERVDAPQLLAVLNPGWQTFKGSHASQFKLHFHVFYSPAIPGGWSDDYPFGSDYLHFMSRYISRVFPPDGNGKGMAYQNVAASGKTIFVFPVGSKKGQLNGIASQGSLLRLLLELTYWIQRVRGVPYPRQRLGGAGISAFSFGANYIVNIMNGPKNAIFWDKVLRMVCVLDGVTPAAGAMRRSVVAWHRGGAGNRHVRLYSQWDAWFWDSDYPASTLTTGFAGAREREGEGLTLLHAPLKFWQAIWPGADWGSVHQVFPAWYMEHAVSNSGFLPP